LTLLLALSTACAGTQGPRPDADTGVRAVLAAQIGAWNRGDLEGFMAGYWKLSGMTSVIFRMLPEG
jgi:hypothetical protein